MLFGRNYNNKNIFYLFLNLFFLPFYLIIFFQYLYLSKNLSINLFFIYIIFITLYLFLFESNLDFGFDLTWKDTEPLFKGILPGKISFGKILSKISRQYLNQGFKLPDRFLSRFQGKPSTKKMYWKFIWCRITFFFFSLKIRLSRASRVWWPGRRTCRGGGSPGPPPTFWRGFRTPPP